MTLRFWCGLALWTFSATLGCFTDNPGTSTTAGPGTSDTTGTTDATGLECPVGDEGCPCTGGGACDGGLTCLSDVCVDASADSATGMVPACGNGELDADEECDGEAGCDDTCELADYVCNPFNQVGCSDTQTCDRTRGATLDDQRTGCFQEGLAAYQASCEYDPLDPNLQCADGLSCVGSGFVPGCEGLAECCTQFCMIGDADCPDPTMDCLTWKEAGMPPGLDDLGLCISL